MRSLKSHLRLAAASLLLLTALPALGAKCTCTAAQEAAEWKKMQQLYEDAVKNARDSGYQCFNDPNYVDKGDGKHPVGNCADWAQVSWAALRVYKWNCWKIVKIRARKKFTWWSYHHFVYVESCSGTGYYLDPWKTGKADIWKKDDFPVTTGFFGRWIFRPLVTQNPGDPPGDPGNDP